MKFAPITTFTLGFAMLATACGTSSVSSTKSAAAVSGASATAPADFSFSEDDRASGGNLTELHITQSDDALATATIHQVGTSVVNGTTQPFATTKTLAGLTCTSTDQSTVCINDARSVGGPLTALQLVQNADGTYTATLRTQGTHRPRPTLYRHSVVLATKLTKA